MELFVAPKPRDGLSKEKEGLKPSHEGAPKEKEGPSAPRDILS
jgi:hypothetical protein